MPRGLLNVLECAVKGWCRGEPEGVRWAVLIVRPVPRGLLKYAGVGNTGGVAEWSRRGCV